MTSHRWLAALFFLIGSITHISHAHAQFGKFYQFEHIQTKDIIKAVAKDAQGYVWVATDEGVLQFDGIHTNMVQGTLPTDYIKYILCTQQGQILVLHDAGIAEVVQQHDSIFFRNARFGQFEMAETLNFPKTIYEDRAGNIWIGEVDAVVRINEAGIKRFFLGPAFQSISYHETFAFTEDAFGHLWVAPFKGVLLSFDQEKDRLVTVAGDYPISEVSGIETVNGDRLYITAKEGLLILKIDSDKNILQRELITEVNNLTAIANPADSWIFLGTSDKGLFRINPQGVIQKLEEVPYPDILNFYVDPANKALWIASSESIGIIKPTQIKTLEHTENHRIESLSMDSTGTYYFSNGQQLFALNTRLQQGARELLYLRNTYFDRILAEGQRVWIGDAFGSIFYYDLHNGQITAVLDSTNHAVTHIMRDSAGNKWFAGHPDHLIRIDHRDSLFYYTSVKNSVVIRESDGGQIICAANGAGNRFYSYSPVDDAFAPMDIEVEQEQSMVINDIQFNHRQHLWIGTNKGLYIAMKTDVGYANLTRLSLSGFDSAEAVKALARTGDHMWIANTYGLLRHDGEQIVIYTPENGLPSRIIKERGVMPEGKYHLLISTAKGVGRIEAGGMLPEAAKTPRPIFRQLVVNGERIAPARADNGSFRYNSKMEAEFLSLTYPGGDVRYQTRVLGIEDEWSVATSNRILTVLGFSEGTYVLEVRARDGASVWSDPLQLHFTIIQPWFKKWWVILLFVALAVVIMATYVKVHNRNLIRQKKKLQKIIEQRSEEISRQKNEMIEQQNKIIQQKEELIEKNKTVFESQRALAEADLNFLKLKEKQLEGAIEFKNKQLTTHTLNILQKNETLKDLRDKLETISKSGTSQSQEVKRSLRLIDESFRLDKDWEEFRLYFEQIYTGFYTKLKLNYPDLTNHELRHCALIRLNLSIAECASVLGISPDSVKVSRTRLRKKLKMAPNQNLTEFILSI